MKKSKRILAMVLTLALLCGSMFTMAACGSNNEQEQNNGGNSGTGTQSTPTPTQAPVAEEPIVLTCYSQLANYEGELVGWFAELLREKFNVVLNIVSDQDGVYETRMESGNLGDIVIWGSNGSEYKNAVKEGMLYDWNADGLLDEFGSYIKENMPNALEANMDLNESVTGERVLYGFGHNVASSPEDHEAFFYTWDLRWDLYQQIGYPEVTDYASMIDMFKKMKEINPTDEVGNETYAVSLWPDWDGTMVMYVKAMATAYNGFDEFTMGMYDCETGTFHGTLEENGPYLQALKFFNDLYQNNLLDPNSMTQTYTEMEEKVRNGGTFFSIFDYAGSSIYNTETHIAQDTVMLPLVPSEAKPLGYGMNVNGGNRIWSIGAKAEYPEVCMEIINWLSTPEGRLTSDYGPKDVCWYYGEDNLTYFTEFGKSCALDRTTQMVAPYTGQFGDGSNQLNNTTWSLSATNPETGERYDRKFWVSEQAEAACSLEADWRTRFGVASVQQYMDLQNYNVAPATTYAETERSDELETIWSEVKTVIVNDSWRAIYAASDEEFDKIVAEMIQKANNFGYDKCMEYCESERAIRYALEQEVLAAAGQ